MDIISYAVIFWEKLNDVKDVYCFSYPAAGGDESVFPKLASWCDSPEKNSYFGFETMVCRAYGFDGLQKSCLSLE